LATSSTSTLLQAVSSLQIACCLLHLQMQSLPCKINILLWRSASDFFRFVEVISIKKVA
jgi:hypothetical protein